MGDIRPYSPFTGYSCYILATVVQTAWKNIKDTHIKVKQKWDKKRRDPNLRGMMPAMKWKFWNEMEFMRDIPVAHRIRRK